MSHQRLWWDCDRNEGAELVDGQMRDANGQPFIELTLEEDGLDVTVRITKPSALRLESALRAWRLS